MDVKEKICPKCGKRFVPQHLGAVYCSFDCRQDAARERARLRARKLRTQPVIVAQKPKRKPSPFASDSNLDKVVKAVMRYNAEHGTRLSYGQYMARFSSRKGGVPHV